MGKSYRAVAKHLGGMEGLKEGAVVSLIVDAQGVTIKKGFTQGIKVNWDRVSSLEVDGSDAVQKRVTATRLLTIGVFAFAAKKKEPSVAYVVLTIDGTEAIFEIGKIKPIELRGRLAPFARRISAPAGGAVA